MASTESSVRGTGYPFRVVPAVKESMLDLLALAWMYANSLAG